MRQAELAWRDSLRAVSIADVASQVNGDYGQDVMGMVHEWLGGGAVAGRPGRPRPGSEVRAGGPLVLVCSADLDSAVAAVTRAGGAVVHGRDDFPGGRRFHATDPSGNEPGVWSER